MRSALVHRLTTVLIAAGCLGLLALVAPTPASALCSAYEYGKTTTTLLAPGWLDCGFGLELWVDGKKSAMGFQQWRLRCEYAQSRATSCSLERTIVTMWPEA